MDDGWARSPVASSSAALNSGILELDNNTAERVMRSVKGDLWLSSDPCNKALNNIVEQDHRFIKKITRPTLGFKTFHQPPPRSLE